MAVCSNCGAYHRPHHMCLECGFYNGRQVLDLQAEKEKREARLKAKKEAIAGALASEDAETAPAETPEAATEETKDVPAEDAKEESKK